MNAPEHKRRRILLAEAEPANRRLLSWTLRVDGFAVDEVSSVGELERARIEGYNLVIASTDLIDAVPRPLHLPGTPLIVIAPSPSDECASSYGAQSCIHRPIYVDELRNAVAACLKPDEEPDLSQPIQVGDPTVEATV